MFIKHKKKNLKKKVPQEYLKFLKLFKEPNNNYYLLEYKLWDYKILFIKGKQPIFKPIYRLFTKEQEVLKDFVETNLRKERIRLFILLAGYPILFIIKKNLDKLRLYINY